MCSFLLLFLDLLRSFHSSNLHSIYSVSRSCSWKRIEQNRNLDVISTDSLSENNDTCATFILQALISNKSSFMYVNAKLIIRQKSPKQRQHI